jgi:hypothetical protein
MLFNSQHFFGCGDRKASDLHLQVKVVLVTVAVASAVIASILLSAVAEFFKLSAIADLALSRTIRVSVSQLDNDFYLLAHHCD